MNRGRTGGEERRAPISDSVASSGSRDDLVAACKFGLVLAVFVSLPDEELAYGLNPRLVWLVVVFVSGLSFGGYVATKLVGPERGVGLTGVLGGCVSSSATVVSMAGNAKREPELESLYAFGAVLASTVMVAKLFAIIALVSVPLAVSIAVPFLGLLVVGAAFAALAWRRFRATKPPGVEVDPQFALAPALAFGAVVALVLLGVEAFDGSIPTTYAELSAVLSVLINIVFKVAITRIGGTAAMARLFAGLLVASSFVGIGLVIWRG